jgi:hypothetical protein
VNWLYVVYGFAVIGAGLVGYWVVTGALTVFGIVRDLSKTLHEAVEIAKEFRSDFGVLRQIAASQATPPFNPEEPTEQAGPPAAPTPFPVPFPGLYRMQAEKPPEPEAEYEKPGQVDVTASEEEVMNQDRIDNLRQMGIPVNQNEEPEPGRTVEAK